jgi:2-polyprenyl-6-methoxyphenol hydroxylase-like FAD-dependent oxidoreductase
MLLRNKRIAIIGAGPVGLAIAKLLQQKGVQVKVYERDKDPQARVWGGTLDLLEDSGQRAMKAAGLLQHYFELAAPMGRTLVDETGNVIFTAKPNDASPEINRTALRKIFLESLLDDTVVWDSKITGMEDQDNKWILHFDSRPDAVADIVIGANGGMSKVRKLVTDAEPAYTGTFIIQGEVVQPKLKCLAFYNLCNDNIFMTAGNGITFVANPNNNGALSYGVTFRKPEEWINGNGLNFQNPADISTFLINMFNECCEDYKELFRATGSFVGLPSRIVSLDKRWKAHRQLPITLIGDAAHIMPPFAGKGVNTGLLDALILSENLTDGRFETIEAAIEDYERQMFVYAKAAQLETRQNESAMHQHEFSFKRRFES